jgi:tRNA A-37 threonylcarbamoyl transferase component Bud32
MSFVEINPAYRDLLLGLGLDGARAFTDLSALIVSGHPGRNVARVTLGTVTGYLKREHAVTWKERLANAWAGFGRVSRSEREARTLQALHQSGLPCSEWLACGEDDRGRAFLLLRAAGGVDLRTHLATVSREERRPLARRLGEALAGVHNAGFDHPDLYSKHVLVSPDGRVCFLDWQRSRRGHVGWPRRWRDLAALHATVADELASVRDRLTFLRAYLRRAGGPQRPVRHAREIDRLARRLLRKRRVRDERLGPARGRPPGVTWLDGEALCVTPEFRDELRDEVPGWLYVPSHPGVTRCVVPLAGGRRGLLVRRARVLPLAWLWAALRQRPLVSPEVRQAGVLFRLQRQGAVAPRLLAFGQRRPRPWRLESFLLTEVPADVVGG